MSKDYIKKILDQLVKILLDSKGFAIYISSNHLCEQWIVLEFIGLLANKPEIEKNVPETDKSVDVFYEDLAIEFKVIGNGRFERNGWDKQSIENDIKKLRKFPNVLNRILIIIDYNDYSIKDFSFRYNELDIKFEKPIDFKSNYLENGFMGKIFFSYITDK